MSTARDLIITLPGGRRVDATVGEHVVRTDQPKDNGGDDSAPAPFDVFLASIGTCAGVFVQGFCAKRGLATDRIRLREAPTYDTAGLLTGVTLAVDLPPDFPEKYKEALIRTIEQCSVKRAIAAQPVFNVTIANAGGVL